MKLVGWSVLVTDTKTKNKEVRGCGYALSYENGCATIPYVCLQHEQLELSEPFQLLKYQMEFFTPGWWVAAPP